jgi:hypothetical protein
MDRYETIGIVLGIVIFAIILAAALLTARHETHA